MFKRIIALLSLAILVVAGDSQCDTGKIMCFIQQQSSEAAEYFGIVERRATNECTGVSVVGTSQSCSANQEPLCCEEVTTVSHQSCQGISRLTIHSEWSGQSQLFTYQRQCVITESIIYQSVGEG